MAGYFYLLIWLCALFLGVVVLVSELIFYSKRAWDFDAESDHWVWRVLDLPAREKERLSPFVTRIGTLFFFLVVFVFMTGIPISLILGL